MSEHLAHNACPSAGRWNRGRLAIVVATVGTVLLLLWWIDPGRVHIPLCGLHTTTGLYCPGCGATRATHHLLHGRLLSALSSNALWLLLVPAVLYAAVSESLRFVRGRGLPGNPLGRPWFYVAVALVATLFGIVRNLPWEPFTWLVPPG